MPYISAQYPVFPHNLPHNILYFRTICRTIKLSCHTIVHKNAAQFPIFCRILSECLLRRQKMTNLTKFLLFQQYFLQNPVSHLHFEHILPSCKTSTSLKYRFSCLKTCDLHLFCIFIGSGWTPSYSWRGQLKECDQNFSKYLGACHYCICKAVQEEGNKGDVGKPWKGCG